MLGDRVLVDDSMQEFIREYWQSYSADGTENITLNNQYIAELYCSVRSGPNSK